MASSPQTEAPVVIIIRICISCQSFPLPAALIIRVEHTVLCLCTPLRRILNIALAVHDSVCLSLAASLDHNIIQNFIRHNYNNLLITMFCFQRRLLYNILCPKTIRQFAQIASVLLSIFPLDEKGQIEYIAYPFSPAACKAFGE